MARLSSKHVSRLSENDPYPCIRLKDPKSGASMMHFEFGWNTAIGPGNIGFQ